VTIPRAIHVVAGALSGLLAACGGGGSGPTPMPTPTTVPGHPVTVVVFYDTNANGVMDPGEHAVPDVEVVIGGRTGRAAVGSGAAELTNVSAGSHAVTLRTETVPPFFQVGTLPTVQVPGDGSIARVGLTLPIGHNRPDVYVAFGDSITRGDETAPSTSYPSRLQARLIAHFGDAYVNNRGGSGNNTFEALERFRRNVPANEPAYTLVIYGTNDWHDPICQDMTPQCHTVANLRTVVRLIKAEGSLPFLATILPVDPLVNGRNEWVDATNVQLKAMAAAEGAFVVDINQAFKNQTSLSALFDDAVHPNAAGYDLIAQAFFEAIAHGRSVP
jgi:lysophospholipase L1-like esterase